MTFLDIEMTASRIFLPGGDMFWEGKQVPAGWANNPLLTHLAEVFLAAGGADFSATDTMTVRVSFEALEPIEPDEEADEEEQAG